MNEENSQNNSPEQKPLQSIHTFEHDIADAMKGKEVSVINIAVTEQEKRKSATIEVKKHAFLIPIIIILLVGTVIAFLIVYLVKQQLNNTATPLETKSRIISTELEHLIPVTVAEDIPFTISNVTGSAGNQPGALARFTFTDERSTSTRDRSTPLPIEGITSQLLTIPSHLARSLTNEYIIGYHMTEASPEPFLILKTTSYETALGGMLEWEPTMIEDLRQLLGSAGFSSTIEGSTFSDLLIRNKDVRIAQDGTGETLLLYSVVDKETIVITSTEESFIEILSRLGTSQFIQ